MNTGTGSAEQQAITVVFPELEEAATGRLVQATFEQHPDTQIITAPNMVKAPETLGYTGERKALMNVHMTNAIPPEWQREDFKALMREMINDGIEKVIEGDVLGLTGGRDYEPALVGMEVHPLSQPYSIFDFRDVIESYMLLAALAHGKTIHATCRGFQQATLQMLKTFADDDYAIPFVQDIPSYYAEQGWADEPSSHHNGIHHQINAIIRENGWYGRLLEQQLAGAAPEFAQLPDAAHPIEVAPSLLYDALLRADSSPDWSDNIQHDVENATLTANMTSLHHQGFVMPEDQFGAFDAAIRQAGGRVIATSADERDSCCMTVVEAVDFSRVIDEASLDRSALPF